MVLRFFGGLFLLLAVITVTADVTRMKQSGSSTLTFASLAKHWSDFAPQSLAGAKKLVETNIHPWLWDPVIASLIGLPAWVSLGALGLLALYGGRRRQKVDVFVN